MTPDQIMHLVSRAFSTSWYDCIDATLKEYRVILARAIAYRESLDRLSPSEWGELLRETHARAVRDAKATNASLAPQLAQITEAIRFLRKLSNTLADSPAREPTQTALKYLAHQLEACTPITPPKKPTLPKFRVDTISQADRDIQIASMNVEHARRRQAARDAIVAARELLAAAVTRHAASS